MGTNNVRSLSLHNSLMPIFKKYLFLRFSRYFEHGLTSKLYDCFKSNSRMFTQKTTKIFDSLEEYIKDGYSGFDNLDIANFRTIFVVYFSLLLIYLTLFIIAHLRKQMFFPKCFIFIKKISFLIIKKIVKFLVWSYRHNLDIIY